jgi:hypothetical protein
VKKRNSKFVVEPKEKEEKPGKNFRGGCDKINIFEKEACDGKNHT